MKGMGPRRLDRQVRGDGSSPDPTIAGFPAHVLPPCARRQLLATGMKIFLLILGLK